MASPQCRTIHYSTVSSIAKISFDKRSSSTGVRAQVKVSSYVKPRSSQKVIEEDKQSQHKGTTTKKAKVEERERSVFTGSGAAAETAAVPVRRGA